MEYEGKKLDAEEMRRLTSEWHKEGRISDELYAKANKIGYDEIEKNFGQAMQFGDYLSEQTMVAMADIGPHAVLTGVVKYIEFITSVTRVIGGKQAVDTFIPGMSKVFEIYGYKVVKSD